MTIDEIKQRIEQIDPQCEKAWEEVQAAQAVKDAAMLRWSPLYNERYRLQCALEVMQSAVQGGAK